MLPRIISALVGLVITLQTITWIRNPAEAAQGLGMQLLDGAPR